jgi:hypothetical protein
MTDPTSPDSTPTTNENLGVVGAQLAAADQQARGNTPENPPPAVLSVGATLAYEALSLAHQMGGTPNEVVARAAEYLKFLKENSNG